MATGVIRWFHEGRGYGFIDADDPRETPEPIYVHHTQILGRGYRSLRAGQCVKFHLRIAEGHPRAVEVEAL
jgi:CspA family cold shock protein